MQKLRFALFGNIYQAKKSASVSNLLQILEQKQADIYIDKEFFMYMREELNLDAHPKGLIEGDDFEADIAVCMGGDGTFLEAARRVGNKGIPIVGINMGRLGFLADISPDEIENIIESIYQNNYTTEERSVLQVETEGGDSLKGYPYALNEVAILKHDNSSMICIRVEVDGEYLTTYQADGLIASTPTGSTGYAMSVGGPIMVPRSGIFGLTAVAPHSLNVRPLTISDNVVFSMTVESRSHNFLIAIDGRSESCHESTKVILRKAPYKIKVLKRANHSYFTTLRNKLMWGTDPRN